MHIAPILPLLFFASVLAADESLKAPWQWTLEERIAKRLSDASVRERAARAERELEEPGGPEFVRQLSTHGGLKAAIDGRYEPELFMPFELFGGLIGSFNPTLPDMRSRFSADIRAAGWDEGAFWKTIREALGPYWELNEKSMALEARAKSLARAERHAVEAEAQSLGVRQCALRAEALQSVRAHYGADAFDRFLYEKVAPKIIIGTDFPFEKEAARLRYVEGGCR
jgi:hypothetical protein